MNNKRLAPYKHDDSSPCWTKNCSRNKKKIMLSIADEINDLKHECLYSRESSQNYGFQSPNEARNFSNGSRSHNKELKQLLFEKYTPEQIRAFMIYTTNGFKQINDLLYDHPVTYSDIEVFDLTGKEGDTQEESLEQFRHFLRWGYGLSGNARREPLTANQVSKIIATLDGALVKHVNSESQILYRGLKRRYMGADSEEELASIVGNRFQPGKTVSFKGYLSTTTNPWVGLGFSATPVGGLNITRPGVLFELKTKSGVDIAPINASPGRSQEDEWLLPRNTNWKVVAVHEPRRVQVVNHAPYGDYKKSQQATIVQLVEV